MNKILITFIFVLTLFTCYAQQNTTIYFYFSANVVPIPDERKQTGSSGPKSHLTFRTQVFQCTFNDNANNDNLHTLRSNLNNEAQSEFRKSIFEYVRDTNPGWASHPRFKSFNNSAVSVYSYPEAQSRRAVSDNYIEINYTFSGCPTFSNQSITNQNTPSTPSNTTQSIGNISSVSRNTNTTSSQDQVYFDIKSNMYTTPEIEAIKVRSQAKYERDMQNVQAISNAVTGIVNYFEEQRQQRLAYEEVERRKEAQEERRKEIFSNQANQYRNELNKIIDARKSFLNQSKLKSTLEEDGTGFKPLFIYFAYAEKDYDYYYENVVYPSTLDFRINQNIDVQFSSVFGFFPYSNGQYPFINDIRQKILDEYFSNKINNYDVVFFQWENSVESVVASLKTNMNKAVNENYFSNSIPSNENNIIFLNSKISRSDSKDYWTGKKIRQKTKDKIDYFDKVKSTKDTTKTKKKKTNYWDN